MSMPTLTMPGAKLHYVERGHGPLLVMIPGGPADTGMFAPLCDALASRYRTVAYDPRGNSGSVFDGPAVDANLDVYGDDAARLIGALGGPAYVLGSSGGAQIGANLAARHPERVAQLIAHEPPCVALLPDGDRVLADMAGVRQTYREQGAMPAMTAFVKLTGVRDRPQPPSDPAALAQMAKNIEYFVAHAVVEISSYRPDVVALRASGVPLTVGIGEESAGELAHRSALALAQALGVTPVTFPGGHVGHRSHPEAFAAVLARVLGS
jgi:pimeloyl-ACP methyl ester carboxylesterase